MKKYNCILLMFIVIFGNILFSNATKNENTFENENSNANSISNSNSIENKNALEVKTKSIIKNSITNFKTQTQTETETENKIINISSLLCKGYKNYIYLITFDTNKNYIYNKFYMDINSETITFSKTINGKLVLKSYVTENLQKINKVKKNKNKKKLENKYIIK